MALIPACLWLLLTDGRVLAFRLPGVALGDDRILAPLIARAGYRSHLLSRSNKGHYNDT